MMAALLSELRLRTQPLVNDMPNAYAGYRTIETVYFGGGTPSLLAPAELEQLIKAIRQQYQLQPGAEITLEANPDDCTDEHLAAWQATGINRLSIGIQSLFDDNLQWMNRTHNAAQGKRVIERARAAGFRQFSVDLIYGTPYLSDNQLQEELEWVQAQNVEHLSCYALTVEEQTPLAKMVAAKKTADVDSEQQSRQFLLLMDKLEQAGYEHYEISNFARPGHHSRHNSSYWSGAAYIGIGPSAHSFDGQSRQWNAANNQQYITALQQQRLPVTVEQLTPVQQINEYIMISIRTAGGCNLEKVHQAMPHKWPQFLAAVADFSNKGWLHQQAHTVYLTKEGKLFADRIAAGLFF